MTVTVKSADRVLDVLELLAVLGRSLSHTEIAQRTGIPKSSLTQILRNLVERNYVYMDPVNRRYQLGEGAYALARQGANITRMVQIAQPALDQLTESIQESSALYILQGDHTERICSARATRARLYSMHLGVRAPLYAASSGKMFLAMMSPEARETYLARVRFERLTDRTLQSATALRRQLPKIRQEQVAFSQGEFTTDVLGISVPVFNRDLAMIAAVGIAGPASRLLGTDMEDTLTALRRCATRISRGMSDL